MPENNDETKLYSVVNRYSLLAGVAALLLCGAIATYINTQIPNPSGTTQDAFLVVVRQIFYSFTGAAALFVALYILLSKNRLTPSQIKDDIKQQMLETQIVYLREAADKFPVSANPEFKRVHYGSFNSLQVWDDEISRAHKSIDIIVYYYDSWIKGHAESLRNAADRGVRIRLFLPDPGVAVNMAAGRALFPELDDDALRDKIQKTPERFTKLGFAKNLEVISVPHPLSYSAQCFDGEKLLLSFFEYGRKLEIASPVVEFDLLRSEKLRRFWEKELFALLEKGLKKQQ